MECRKILSGAVSVPQLAEAQTVLAYWPKLEVREIDLRPLICWLRARGCVILLPIVEPKPKFSRMHWGYFENERTLVQNHWGIFEPPRRAAVSPDEIDVVLVPGLGFDRAGHRVGYGGGYYDRLLRCLNAFKLGFVMDMHLFELIRTEPHDIAVDFLVTSNQLLKPN